MQQFFLGGAARPLSRILCIGAHCDDIEIGCGGLLMRLSRAFPSIEVTWFIASAPADRLLESSHAAQRLLAGIRAHDIQAESFPDGELPYAGTEIKRCMRKLGERQAVDLVLTHSLEDAHQDHRFLAELTWQTFRDHLILEYEIPKYDGDLGPRNWFVPLERQVAEGKIECLLDSFASQRAKPWFDAETFRGLMRLRGIECRAPSGFAEAFRLRKGIWQFP